jgi:hypothetical protein
LEFLGRCDDELRAAASIAAAASRTSIENAVGRTRARLREITAELAASARVNAQALERDLDAIDRMLLEAGKSFALKPIRISAVTVKKWIRLSTIRPFRTSLRVACVR